MLEDQHSISLRGNYFTIEELNSEKYLLGTLSRD
jgi:hypothetical protein